MQADLNPGYGEPGNMDDLLAREGLVNFDLRF